MLVTVKVSGLPAGAGVRLALDGLSDLGMIHLVHR